MTKLGKLANTFVTLQALHYFYEPDDLFEIDFEISAEYSATEYRHNTSTHVLQVP